MYLKNCKYKANLHILHKMSAIYIHHGRDDYYKHTSIYTNDVLLETCVNFICLRDGTHIQTHQTYRSVHQKICKEFNKKTDEKKTQLTESEFEILFFYVPIQLFITIAIKRHKIRTQNK